MVIKHILIRLDRFFLCGAMLAFYVSMWSQTSSVDKIAESLKLNVVAVRVKFEDGSDENGFGFITGVQDNRLFLATAAHIVTGINRDQNAVTIKIKFFSDISWYPATFKYQWEEEDLALLELPKPGFLKWQNNCLDSLPENNAKVQFIGMYEDGPKWANPGLDGNIFNQTKSEINFAINTIRPGSSGAPLITEKGIAGLIIKDEGNISKAVKITHIKELFSNNGQYPYFDLSPLVTSEEHFNMVFVKGGTFYIGCNNELEGDCDSLEKATRKVTVKDFYISKYEITQAQWREIMGHDPFELGFKGCDQCPVEQVTWSDAQEFLYRLNLKTGKKYRFPTEAEWEYAYLGGSHSKGYKYSGSNDLNEVAWHGANSGGRTHPVGSKKANELGLFDMSGNVHEWFQEISSKYSKKGRMSPRGISVGYHFLGGGWNTGKTIWESPGNSGYSSNAGRYNFVGFRIAL